MTTESSLQTFAAVDLGSNSFHLLVVRREPDGSLTVLDRLKEMVRLAAGLDDQNHLSREAQARALDSLVRIGQCLRDIPPSNIRVVGTSTFRRARDSGRFLEAAGEALGCQVEVVSGVEEARLIHLGATRGVSADERSLVVDIGGGSTELVVGQGSAPLDKASLHIGCVSHSREYFPDTRITREQCLWAETAARMELEPIEGRLRERDWEQALGASGTVRAVAASLAHAGWTDGRITFEGLTRQRERLIEAGRLDRADLSAVKPERREVFAGGLAILRAVFAALGIREMAVAQGAMREGILYDLLGRQGRTDPRRMSVEWLADRFHADPEQAGRVAETAGYLFEQTRDAWELDDAAAALLQWAARLHEVGLDVAYAGCHKHSAYIVAHSDLPGFAQAEQKALAVLVRSWRRKFPAAQLAAFGDVEGPRLARLAVLLRLAAALHRGRRSGPVPYPHVHVDQAAIDLRLPCGWLADHPLTRADLADEAKRLATGGFSLDFGDNPAANARGAR